MTTPTAALTSLLLVISVPMLAVGLAELAYHPLALRFQRRCRWRPVFSEPVPLVSIVVPGFNEATVIENCIESILRDYYPRKQVILVDDGSTDDTLAIMRRYERSPQVVVLTQRNVGKAAALNAGLSVADGEVLVFVDADGVLTRTTIANVLAGFDSPMVGAVCGNDEPINLNHVQTRLLALLTHGTAFVRRALAQINCLTIVSGNIGAFRSSVLQRTGGFTPGLVGEDLELTWRVHRAGYRVNFQPGGLVYAEVPSTVRALWRQRVRWTRGHIQTVRMHHDMMFRGRYGAAGFYLPLNVFTMLIAPVLQLVALVVVGILAAIGSSPVSPTVLGIVLWLGFGFAMASTCFAIVLDKAWHDLRLLYVLPLWPLLSLMMSLVTLWAIIQEIGGAPARWNKSARSGVVSRPVLAAPGRPRASRRQQIWQLFMSVFSSKAHVASGAGGDAGRMTISPRMAVLVAAVALPLVAALASYAVADESAPPRIPDTVRIGEAASSADDDTAQSPSPRVQPDRLSPSPAVGAGQASTTAPAQPRPRTRVVQPPPPLGDDDNAGDDDGAGDG